MRYYVKFDEAGILKHYLACNEYVQIMQEITKEEFINILTNNGINPNSIGVDINPESPTEITSGTYIGTGLYGETNPNTISPNTKARVLMILQNDETLLTLTRIDLTDEPFTWFKSSAKEQCNENGVVYNWIAIT